MQLTGKVVLVTGGGTGIGKAVAELFAAEGAQVVITGRRAAKLQEVCDSIDSPHPVRLSATDVANREQVTALVNWVHDEFGPIDILVNNAGINIVRRRVAQLSVEDWDYVMNVNATGAFNVIHAVLPQMRTRKDGVIICVSSIAGIRPSVLAGAAYSASKHAMTALTKVIGLEDKDNGIRTTCIHPGEVETPILDDRPVAVSAAHRSKILQPEDVAAAALFVALLHPRANVPELIIKPTNAAFS